METPCHRFIIGKLGHIGLRLIPSLKILTVRSIDDVLSLFPGLYMSLLPSDY